MLSFCESKYLPSSQKDYGNDFLSMDFKSFYMQPTEGEVNHEDGPVQHSNLLVVRTTSMDVDPFLREGEVQANAYMKVQQVSYDTDPLMRWKQHEEVFPESARMDRQYLPLLCLHFSGCTCHFCVSYRDSSVVWDL